MRVGRCRDERASGADRGTANLSLLKDRRRLGEVYYDRSVWEFREGKVPEGERKESIWETSGIEGSLWKGEHTLRYQGAATKEKSSPVFGRSLAPPSLP